MIQLRRLHQERRVVGGGKPKPFHYQNPSKAKLTEQRMGHDYCRFP